MLGKKMLLRFISIFCSVLVMFIPTGATLAALPVNNLSTNPTFSVNGNSEARTIDAQNAVRTANTLVIYTNTFGEKTKTNPWGAELSVNSNFVVESIRPKGTGDASGSIIPPRGFVLSAHGTKEALLNDIKVGDTITLDGIKLITLNTFESFPYDAINPNATNNPGGVDPTGTPFPGFRGGNQLVIYNKDFPQPETGTNSYGVEVIAQGGDGVYKIISAGGNNSTIPADGIVLSGHGTAASFLLKNSFVGAEITINEAIKEIQIKVTPESIATVGSNKIAAAEQKQADALLNLRDIDYEEVALQLSKAKAIQIAVDTLVTEIAAAPDNQPLQFQFLDLVEEVKNYTLLAEYALTESRVIEARGIWHRPIEQSLEAVKATLAELQSQKINLLYLETFFHGYTIADMPDGSIVEQNPLFKNSNYGKYNNDLLKAFVEEAPAYGIEVHFWVHDFFVGYQGPGSPILEKKPEWELLNYEGKRETTLEGGIYYFMDPSNPEVTTMLKTLYTHLVSTYNPQGLQLDYIRYPVGEYKNDWGYNESSVQRFYAAHNIDPATNIKDYLDIENNPAGADHYQQWEKWKQNNITSFVKSIHESLADINPKILLSTAIFANIEEAKSKKMQDWPTWVEENYLQITAPMAYYKDTKTVGSAIKEMVQYVEGKTLNYAGLAPTFMGLHPEYNMEQISAARNAKAQGSVLFASQNVLGLNDVKEVLSKSTNRQDAILPHGDMNAILDTLIADIERKADTLYLPQLAMSETQKAQLLLDIQKIKTELSSNSEEKKKLDALANAFAKLSENATLYGNDIVALRLSEEFSYLNTIFKTRSSWIAPTEETTTPIEETSTPIEETSTPIEETSTPIEETSTPIEETSTPIEETSTPIEETSKPIEETSTPIEETSKPIEETSTPIEETTKPQQDIKITVSVNAVSYNLGTVVTEEKFLSDIGLTTDVEATITTNFAEVVDFTKKGIYDVTVEAKAVNGNMSNSAVAAVNSISIKVAIGTELTTEQTTTTNPGTLVQTGQQTLSLLLGSAVTLLISVLLILRKK